MGSHASGDMTFQCLSIPSTTSLLCQVIRFHLFLILTLTDTYGQMRPFAIGEFQLSTTPT